MNPETSPVNPETVKNPLSAMGANEVVIFEVKPHPIGLLSMYLSFGLLVVLVGAGAIAAPNVLTDVNVTTNTVRMIGLVAFLFAVVFAGLFGTIAHIVYYGNRWVLTSDSLTQIQQNSLFNKQNSQLSLGNLEDITARQDGIMAHLFNYGVLRVETAGERSKFSFPYCPNPNFYAQKILQAREEFEQGDSYRQKQPQNPPTITT